MSLAATTKVNALRARAAMLRAARQFFYEREVTEVDVPLLTRYPTLDPYIAVIPAVYGGQQRCYLHTSPEYGMKALLADGMGDIFQLSHVFRDGEAGERHNPEFTLCEWYRIGWSLEALQEETVEFIRLFVGRSVRFERLSYAEALQVYSPVRLDSPRHDLLACLEAEGISGPVVEDAESQDELLNLIFGLLVEPQLGNDCIVIVCDYPPGMAELAQVKERNGQRVAERFEAYYQGYELANGYHELLDAAEQRHRFEARNAELQAQGRAALPLDEDFLAALERGIPDCCGVAVGFDRLMMLKQGCDDIAHILPRAWEL
jgi:lysyl-tRNA synthetase class 2